MTKNEKILEMKFEKRRQRGEQSQRPGKAEAGHRSGPDGGHRACARTRKLPQGRDGAVWPGSGESLQIAAFQKNQSQII